jgi:hypothetical protein
MHDITEIYPIPADNGRRGAPAVYPFGRMKVGDSFAIPLAEAERARSAAVKWKARHCGWAYATRATEDGFCRIWRTG